MISNSFSPCIPFSITNSVIRAEKILPYLGKGWDTLGIPPTQEYGGKRKEDKRKESKHDPWLPCSGSNPTAERCITWSEREVENWVFMGYTTIWELWYRRQGMLERSVLYRVVLIWQSWVIITSHMWNGSGSFHMPQGRTRNLRICWGTSVEGPCGGQRSLISRGYRKGHPRSR